MTSFPVGATRLCVDAGVLRSVVPRPSLAPVPGAPPWIVGVYNDLGRAVAAIDAAHLLGLAHAGRPTPFLLLVETPSGILGLCADGPTTEVVARTPPRRGAVVEVVNREHDLLRIDLPLLEAEMEASLSELAGKAL